MSATSQTPQTPTNREWLRKLITGRPHQVIGGVDRPYLRRWYLIPRNPVINVYLHQFLRSDDDRALHDHPWWFVSLMLRGEYDEVSEGGVKRRLASARFVWGLAWSVVGLLEMRRNRRAGTQLLLGGLFDIAEAAQRDGVIAFRPATWRHRVRLIDIARVDGQLVLNPAWTVIVTGRRARTWGFWCRQPAWPGADRHHYVDRFVPWTEFDDAGCGETS